ncbi:hypothetical protein K488DRAFT_53350 [Vararia minispora EC-137]|uniref:Uncharacterized protein n=1 Tax=Vararia minispora EC-137 TaxID=1314806 RepID=A0ACB8QGL7_9AGAM|nr:hypothetical protein K488DRAFT_53350 [Vararia minispora EC-137]
MRSHFLSTFFAVGVYAQSFNPGAVPLAVRSTYLNAYSLHQTPSRFPSAWPNVNSDPVRVAGRWSGLLKIDGTLPAYSWLGDVVLPNITASNVSAITLTPTKTVVSMVAGPLNFNVTFLSPIEPGDFIRQSIPFSYMTFECSSNDGNAHEVQIFTDVSGEWLSGDRTSIMTWSTTVDNATSSIYHSAELKDPMEYTERQGQAQWGTLYYATQNGNGVTYRTNSADNNRNQFLTTGKLDKTQDTNFRAIADNFATLAFSYDLGRIRGTQEPVVFAVGFTRNNAIKYTDLSLNNQDRSLFYAVNFTDAASLINFVLNDYNDTLIRNMNLDNRLLKAATAAAAGSTYSDLISLTTRQLFGSTELTIGLGNNGKLNRSDTMMFMRNTNSANPGRIQPVEVLYAAWPLFMTIDPTLGPALLEPLFRFQRPSSYTLRFAAPDLGTAYPNATAANNAHKQGIEQSANMIIMSYSHALISGDGTVVARYYDLLKTWTDYLVDNALYPTNQLSADQLDIANQTNLAIKGIIAIAAMSKISSAVNEQADAQQFNNNATSMYTQWKSMALGQNNKMLIAYGRTGTWTLGYSLFADKWLGLNLVDSFVSVLTNQFQSFVADSTNSAVTAYGLPTDSSDTSKVVASWNMHTAAYVPDSAIQSTLISRIHNRASLGTVNDGLPQTFNSTSGVRVIGFTKYVPCIHPKKKYFLT